MSRTLVARTIVVKVVHELIRLGLYPNKVLPPEDLFIIENKLTEVVAEVLEDEDM